MKSVKQITFNLTESRRIKNYAQKNNLEEKEVLSKYPKVMHILFQTWKKNQTTSQEISFKDFFLQVMKFAEFEFRLKERKGDLKLINEHVKILRDALEEYEQDYTTVIKIEKIVKDIAGGTFL